MSSESPQQEQRREQPQEEGVQGRSAPLVNKPPPPRQADPGKAPGVGPARPLHPLDAAAVADASESEHTDYDELAQWGIFKAEPRGEPQPQPEPQAPQAKPKPKPKPKKTPSSEEEVSESESGGGGGSEGTGECEGVGECGGEGERGGEAASDSEEEEAAEAGEPSHAPSPAPLKKPLKPAAPRPANLGGRRGGVPPGATHSGSQLTFESVVAQLPEGRAQAATPPVRPQAGAGWAAQLSYVEASAAWRADADYEVSRSWAVGRVRERGY